MLALNDDGYMDLKINEVEQKIDIYSVYCEMVEIARRLQGRPIREYNAALVEMLQGLGFPACSHRLANRIDKALGALIADLEKKDSAFATPASQKPTEPASSASRDPLTV